MRIVFSFVFVLVISKLQAQPGVQLKNELLRQLNTWAAQPGEHHFAYTNMTKKVDTPYVISQDGMLSVTFSYTTDTSYHRVRQIAPLEKVKAVIQDVYLLLLFDEEDVLFYHSDEQGKPLMAAGKGSLFHVSMGDDDNTRRDSLRSILSRLLNRPSLYDQRFKDYPVPDSLFFDGLALVERDRKYGFIDSSLHIAVPLMYEQALDFSEGLAAVQQQGKWGYINVKGKVVIPFIYQYAQSFEGGNANVYRHRKWIIIDKRGKKMK